MRSERIRAGTADGFRGGIAAVVILLAAACGTTASPQPSASTPAPTSAATAATGSATSPAGGPTNEPDDPGSPSPPGTFAPGSWIPAGDLGGSFARDGSVVALKGGGALLIRYGEDERMVTERWDPATVGWQPAPALERPRTQFAAVALRDAQVLVAGGYNEAQQSYSSAYLYDEATGAWTKTGLMVAARTSPSAALLPDGRVLVAGGYFYQQPDFGTGPPGVMLAAHVPPAEPPPTRLPLNDVDVPPHGYALASAELFDPASGTWSETGPMTFARSGAAAVTLADGRVLVVGSSADEVDRVDRRAYETAEIYDPRTGTFTMAGTLPDIDRPAIEGDGVVLPEGDPAPATVGELAALGDGGALLVAHSGWWKHEGDVVRTFRFDAAGLGWTQVGPAYATAEDNDAARTYETPGISRVGAFVASLGDGRVLAAGGNGKFAYVSEASTSAELFDQATGTWSPAPDLPEPRLYGSAVTLADGSALIVGGSRWEETDEGWESVDLRTTLRFATGG